MPRRLNLPDSASVAHADPSGKLFAPSAARNIAPLIEALGPLLPPAGTALEIASGTGQHIVEYARAFPSLTWQASEIDPARRDSIRAYIDATPLPNLSSPIALDATAPGWSSKIAPASLIVASNLLHLVSLSEAQTLISEAAKALDHTGQLVIYGPFKRDNQLVSDGDAAFDASLRKQDPEIGYKCATEISAYAETCGLTPESSIEMPANNLLLCWPKTQTSSA